MHIEIKVMSREEYEAVPLDDAVAPNLDLGDARVVAFIVEWPPEEGKEFVVLTFPGWENVEACVRAYLHDTCSGKGPLTLRLTCSPGHEAHFPAALTYTMKKC